MLKYRTTILKHIKFLYQYSIDISENTQTLNVTIFMERDVAVARLRQRYLPKIVNFYSIIKKVLVRPPGVISANLAAVAARISVAVPGWANTSLSAWSFMAAITLGWL